ncbi:hypothetical protein [Bosea sp. (in: a-proteobacteria)]|uniref:hypothetical protein n=1 Tax=Bosea sp. (in: a-proteobacteria) TaxID=1871050 RepID=UPI0026319169|nr:hypothetical protein [Bosea sp. (in: a-proteobacteria)]MCO5090572.1 hypothetical protein [Bosea sp. (in: a-proteobacteria)]
MRSRFHVAALVLAGGLLLGACSHHFGPGIAGLPATEGWQPLPIGSWVLNEGLQARAMTFCPREACARQGFAAVIALEGERAREMERALSQSPARLGRAFARLAADKAAERRKAQRKQQKKAEPKPARSATEVIRIDSDQAKGVLVTIRSLDAGGRRAVAAILYGREDDRLVVALAVSETAEAARREAEAAWQSR